MSRPSLDVMSVLSAFFCVVDSLSPTSLSSHWSKSALVVIVLGIVIATSAIGRVLLGERVMAAPVAGAAGKGLRRQGALDAFDQRPQAPMDGRAFVRGVGDQRRMLEGGDGLGVALQVHEAFGGMDRNPGV